MPDFPKKATPDEVWAYAARTITHLTGDARVDLIGQDNSLEATTGTRVAKIDNVDASVASRAAPTDILAGEDKIDGSLIDAAISDTAVETGGRLDNVPAYLTPVESSVLMDGTIKTLVEITDVKAGQIEAWVDLTPMDAGDTIVIRYSRKMKSAGDYVKYAEETYSGAQTIPALCILNKMIYRSVLITAQQTALGVYRTLDIQTIRTMTV